MTTINRLWAACFLPVLIVAATAGNAPAQAPVSLDAIEKAWQDRVKSAIVEWTEKQTITKGEVADGKSGGPIIPPEDSTHEVKKRLCLDGDKMRYEHDGRCWSVREAVMLTKPYLSTFDGKIGKSLDSAGVGSSTHPQGVINAEKYHRDVHVAHVIPILMAFRANDPKMSTYSIEELELTGKRQAIEGHKCLELLKQTPDSNYRVRIWVDPERDFVIVRKMTFYGEQVDSKSDIEYERHAGAGWAPKQLDEHQLPSEWERENILFLCRDKTGDQPRHPESGIRHRVSVGDAGLRQREANRLYREGRREEARNRISGRIPKNIRAIARLGSAHDPSRQSLEMGGGSSPAACSSSLLRR